MKKTLLFLIIVTSTVVFSQETETIYLDRKGNVCEKGNHHSTRVAEFNDSLVFVTEMSTNRKLIMKGSYIYGDGNFDLANLENEKRYGAYTIYNRRGKREKTELAEPALHLEYLYKFHHDSTDFSFLADPDLEFRIYYYHSGRIKKSGFVNRDNSVNGVVQTYERKDSEVGSIVTYKNSKKYGTVHIYSDGVILLEIEYYEDKMHGEKRVYDFLGQLKKTTHYEHGKRVD